MIVLPDWRPAFSRRRFGPPGPARHRRGRVVDRYAVERQTGWVGGRPAGDQCGNAVQALLTAQQFNETDRNDARGTAQMIPSYSPPTISPATRTVTLSAFPGR
jgi:hypothetical protein